MGLSAGGLICGTKIKASGMADIIRQNENSLGEKMKKLYSIIHYRKGPVNPTGESSSFIFTACVKSVPLDHFKLSCLVLHMAVKEFFETHY